MTKYLYRKVRLAVTLAAGLVLILPPLQAQYRPPQPERKTPRAVGVLETFPNGTRRLVPVTFFYERHYYDAAFYHATPVPLTLNAETVYEVQQYGKALGTFTVQSATESPALNADESATAWFGLGRFKAAADERAKKRPARPVVIADSSRPVLHRRPGSEGDNPAPHSSASTSEASTSQASTTQAEDDDPERPRLHRKEGSGDSSTGPATAPAPTQASTVPPPNMGSTSGATSSATATAKTEPEPASDDPVHPILRRGKPAQEQSGPDLPEFHSVAKPEVAKPGSRAGVPGNASQEPVTRQVAVSDAGPSEEQSLIYVCNEEQRKQLESAARELARQELRRMAAHRGLVLPVAPKAASTKVSAAKKKAAAEAPPAELPELKLQDEQFVPYALDYNSYATVVFSGRYVEEPASSPSAGAATATSGASGAGAKSWMVTVVARQDDGKLVKLYSAVSDPRELDLYPEVRLVDAVDSEGYSRYGLLFRERKRSGVSWLLGRPNGFELQTLFETTER